MIRVAAVLLLTLMACASAQDESRLSDLLQKLDDDKIEVRSAAADALARMSSAVLPTLRRTAISAGPEIRDRLGEIIRKIEERERLAALLPPPSRITLEAKNRPLREVLLAVAKQSSTPIEVRDVPADARVTVSLRQMPLWKALEAVCKASGKAMVGVDGDHILITGEPYVELPGRMTDHFRVTLDSIELRSNGTFGQPDRFETFNATFHVNWEKGARPWRVVGQLLELVDESGTDLVGGAEGEGQVISSIAADMIHHEFVLDWPHGPGPQSLRIARLKAGIEFQFPLRYAEVKLDVSNGKIPAVAECPEYSVKLTHLDRQDGVLMGNLTFVTGAMPPEGDLGAESVFLKDKNGKEYRGNVNDGNSANENETAYLISFPDAPATVVPAEILIRIPSEIHREKLDVELKDVSLK